MGRLLIHTGPHIYFLLYFLVCLFTANERILYTDSAYYLYSVINDGAFYVPHNRYIAAAAQLMPLAGIRLDLSLPLIVKLYALNIALIPYLGYLIVRYLWKQPFFALSFILLSSVFQHHAFFSPIAELVLGLYVGLLWLAYSAIIIRHSQMKTAHMVTVVLILAALYFTHPITVASTLIATGLLVLFNLNRWGILLTIGLIATIVLRILTFNSYESGKWAIFEGVRSSLPAMANSYVTNFLALEFITVLLPAILFTVYAIYLIWNERNRLVAIALTALFPAFVAFTILLNFRYETFYAYVEGYMTPFFFIAGAVGLHAMYGKPADVAYRHKVGLVVLALGVISLVRLTWEPAYRHQKMFLAEIMQEAEQQGCHKVELDDAGFELEPNILTKWSVPYESILYSSLDGKPSSIIYYEGYDRDTSHQLTELEFYGADWERIIPHDRLQKRYIKLPEGVYCTIQRQQY